ncbi:hypothetical protein OsI_11129 [Oryza sativa Indica Group]|uniref:Uncharacterized protein n=1 Tax=Oryza sativa subsp. indica TaxID=39946 RepID=A2XFI8_ORYSI|nr:hypothetical protein OsI_11129 [Oryza sativa Indica Group]
MSPMLTTCWCLAAAPPLLAWRSNCVGDADAAITVEVGTGNGTARLTPWQARRSLMATVRQRRGKIVAIPRENDDALAPGEGDRGAAYVGGLYELYATLPPCGEGGG